MLNDKSSKILLCKYAYSRFQRDCKEGESGTIFGKFVSRNENLDYRGEHRAVRLCRQS